MKKTLMHGLFISTLLLMPMGLVGMTPTDSGSGMMKHHDTTTTVPPRTDTDHMMQNKDHMMKDKDITKPSDKVDGNHMTTVGWRYWGPRSYYGYGYGYYPRTYYYNNWGYPYGYGSGYGYGSYGYGSGYGSGWVGPYYFYVG